jgi:hypothetical protein
VTRSSQGADGQGLFDAAAALKHPFSEDGLQKQTGIDELPVLVRRRLDRKLADDLQPIRDAIVHTQRGR